MWIQRNYKYSEEIKICASVRKSCKVNTWNFLPEIKGNEFLAEIRGNAFLAEIRGNAF